MAALSDYLENKLLNHLLGTDGGSDWTPPATLYFALFTAAPNDAGGGTEVVSSNGYARKAVTNNATNFPSTSNGTKSNGADIVFATATGAWSASASITHFGIYDASSSGNLLAWGALTSPFTVTTNGDTVTFATGALVITLTSGGFGDTWRNAALNLAFGAESYTRPATVYAAAFTAAPGYTGGGTEVTGGSYARVSIANNQTNFPAASGGAKSNGTAVTFPTATGTWGTVTDVALFTAASGGSILAFCTLSASRSVVSGDTARIAIGDFDFALD